MARVNIYLPGELASEAREAGLNISGVAQDALRRALASRETESWLDRLDARPRLAVDHGSVLRAIDEARDELGDGH